MKEGMCVAVVRALMPSGMQFSPASVAVFGNASKKVEVFESAF